MTRMTLAGAAIDHNSHISRTPGTLPLERLIALNRRYDRTDLFRLDHNIPVD
jgi:hypothetical protein